MSDRMNGEQYRKACRYRMQEMLEDLAGAWTVPDEAVDNRLIENSLHWLQRTLDELHYFQDKIVHAAPDAETSPGYVDVRR